VPDADLRLLADLDAFQTEHRRCGELDGGIDDAMVCIACDWEASGQHGPTRPTRTMPPELEAPTGSPPDLSRSGSSDRTVLTFQ